MDKETLNINQIKKQPFRITGRPVSIRAGENAADVMTMSFDPEGKHLAVGTFDGAVKLFSPFTGKMQALLNPPAPSGTEPLPVSQVSWRPQWAGQTLRASTVLCTTTADGSIQHWSLTTMKQMNEMTEHRDVENNLTALDYTRDGKKFCCGGRDRNVYVYDDHTRELITTMHSRGQKVWGHRNRIFSIKCHPDDENLLVSAGWDGAVKIYDIRDKAPVGSMRGPEISGDSLDIFEDLIVSGSYRNQEAMQIFSISQRKRVHTWEWNQSRDLDSGYCFSTRFTNDGNFIIAGGAGNNELKVFMNNSDTTATFKLQMEVKNLPCAITNVATNPNPDTKQIAFGLSNGMVYVLSYEVDANAEFEPYTGDIARVAKAQIKVERERIQRAMQALGPQMTLKTQLAMHGNLLGVQWKDQ